jgi:hypothetical protein
MHLPALLEEDHPVFHAAQASGKGGLAVDGRGRNDLGQPPLESPIIRLVP